MPQTFAEYEASYRPSMVWFDELTDSCVDPDTLLVQVKDEKQLKITSNIYKNMEMDLTDLLLSLFKGQPRVINTQLFKAELYSEGRRHFELDKARFEGHYVIYFKGWVLARAYCKPHKLVKIIGHAGSDHARVYAKALLERLLSDLVPQARLEKK